MTSAENAWDATAPGQTQEEEGPAAEELTVRTARGSHQRSGDTGFGPWRPLSSDPGELPESWMNSGLLAARSWAPGSRFLVENRGRLARGPAAR